jgi:arylsulfatase A-like enzyme
MFVTASAFAQTPGKKPNIVVVVGDDLGIWDIAPTRTGYLLHSHYAARR